jgi:hypothetical protein
VDLKNRLRDVETNCRAIFSNDGHFSHFQSRAEIPRIAVNDRAKGAAPEDAQSIVASSIAY